MKHLEQVSVAILSCNRREDLRITLDQLLERGPIWREVVVADNASSDGTVEILRVIVSVLDGGLLGEGGYEGFVGGRVGD